MSGSNPARPAHPDAATGETPKYPNAAQRSPSPATPDPKQAATPAYPAATKTPDPDPPADTTSPHHNSQKPKINTSGDAPHIRTAILKQPRKTANVSDTQA
jgi:hypothetical protein